MRKLKEEVFRRAFFDCSKNPGDFTGVEQEAADYYQELIDLGPDFVAEYGDEE